MADRAAADASGLRSPDARERRAAAARLGRSLRDRRDPAAAAALLEAAAGDDPDLAAGAAFAYAIADLPGGPARLADHVGAAGRDAAALGLGSLAGEDVEASMLALLQGADPLPPHLPGALFSHYRWRGRPAPERLPSPTLLRYADHPEIEGRAGLAHLARAIKDPVLVPVLVTLAGDEAWEVRRAAAIAMARSPKLPWSPADAATIRESLATLRADGVEHVVVAAVRATGSFDDPGAVPALVASLDHAAFHVRGAAVQALASRKATDAAPRLAELARSDPSVLVRGAAASAVASLAPEAAAALADDVLADEAEFVRAAACELLAAVAGDAAPAATARLIELAETDPHVRVRHTALGALEGRAGEATDAALSRALADDPDPVVVAVACGVVESDERRALLPLVRQVPGRFPGRLGADARDSALSCVASLQPETARAFLLPFAHDPDPSVAWSAQKALAEIAGIDAPAAPRAGVTGAHLGELADLGVFVRDPVLVLETTRGTMRVRLFADVAPAHAARVVAHARAGGYDGNAWHRVVSDFVIQGGCPRGDGSGNAGVTLPLESTRIPFERGVLGMPRSGHPDSGGCQLFIMHSRAPHLDVQYTAFGRVTDGLDVIDRIDVDDRILGASVEEATGER